MNLSSVSLPNCNLNHTPFLNAKASRYIGSMDRPYLVVADQEIRKLRIFASLKSGFIL